MARKNSFKKAYVGIVIDMALARNKISNRMVAQRLEIDEATIRNWRKEHADFNRAFTEAREVLMEKINNVAGKSLDVRKRKIVSRGSAFCRYRGRASAAVGKRPGHAR